MPIQHAIWKVGNKPELLAASRLPNEQKLEEMIVAASRCFPGPQMKMQTPGSRFPPLRAATVTGDLYKSCACLRGQNNTGRFIQRPVTPELDLRVGACAHIFCCTGH